MAREHVKDGLASERPQLVDAMFCDPLQRCVMFLVYLHGILHNGEQQEVFDTLSVLELVKESPFKYLGNRFAVETALLHQFELMKHMVSILTIQHI